MKGDIPGGSDWFGIFPTATVLFEQFCAVLVKELEVVAQAGTRGCDVGCGLVKGEYLFGTGTVRPFVGLGAGLYTIGSHSIAAGPNTQGIQTKVGDYLGFAPQLGVDLGRVRLAATYNAIVGAGIDVHETAGATTSVSQNYLSIELSFRFGGGPKQNGVP